MKKRTFLIVLFAALFLNVTADVTEQREVSVSYPEFGAFKTTSIVNYHNLLKREETDSSVKGKGFLGKLIVSFFPKGKDAQIYNLEEKMIYTLDLDKKKYSKYPIKKYHGKNEYGTYSDEEEKYEEDYEEDKQYRIIRQELKVIDAKEKSEINQFKTNKYHIIYIYEIEEIETKNIHTDSLFIEVFTTSDTEIFERSEKEKNAFNQAMLEAVGIEVDEEFYEEMMGLNWIRILQAMDKESQKSEYSLDYKELKKIKGYPVLVDGTFYSKDVLSAPKEPEKKKGFGGLGSLKKSLLKSAEDAVIGKEEESEGYKEALSFRNETVSISFDKITENTFKVPKGFKEIKTSNSK